MIKILTWLMANLASVFGIIQAILKLLKEIITALLNFMSLAIPNASWKDIVEKARDIINRIDEIIEKAKGFFLKKGN